MVTFQSAFNEHQRSGVTKQNDPLAEDENTAMISKK